MPKLHKSSMGILANTWFTWWMYDASPRVWGKRVISFSLERFWVGVGLSTYHHQCALVLTIQAIAKARCSCYYGNWTFVHEPNQQLL